MHFILKNNFLSGWNINKPAINTLQLFGITSLERQLPLYIKIIQQNNYAKKLTLQMIANKRLTLIV
jgi:hypothetical protein